MARTRIQLPGAMQRGRESTATDSRDDPGLRNHGWRTEGPNRGEVPPARGGQERRGFWQSWPPWLRWLLLLILVLNWLVASMLLGTTDQVEVSYSFFRDQAQVGNVSQVTSFDDQITGSFKSEVAYSTPGTGTVRVKDFQTYRPAFADDDLVQLPCSPGSRTGCAAACRSGPGGDDRRRLHPGRH